MSVRSQKGFFVCLRVAEKLEISGSRVARLTAEISWISSSWRMSIASVAKMRATPI